MRNAQILAQSIGYYPSLNLGFNPYLSPVFGYGLGLPYGAQGIGPTKDPVMASSLIGPQTYKISHPSDILGKIHAKIALKKLPFGPYSLYMQPGYLKSRLGSLKYPYAPLGLGNYGYGKHYGSAMIPNNPYKSVYGEFYASESSPLLAPAPAIPSTIIHNHNQASSSSQHGTQILPTYQPVPVVKPTHNFMKPLIKTGALLTTAALLGKKLLETPFKLDPAGMILNNYHP